MQIVLGQEYFFDDGCIVIPDSLDLPENVYRCRVFEWASTPAGEPLDDLILVDGCSFLTRSDFERSVLR